MVYFKQFTTGNSQEECGPREGRPRTFCQVRMEKHDSVTGEFSLALNETGTSWQDVAEVWLVRGRVLVHATTS
jgi:hypothetical protein